MPTAQKTRIFLADDHETVREGLKLLLNAQADMEIVGEAGDGASAVSLVGQLKPDIIVLDVSMPGMNGLKAAEALRRSSPDVKVLDPDAPFRRWLPAPAASGGCGRLRSQAESPGRAAARDPIGRLRRQVSRPRRRRKSDGRVPAPPLRG